MTEVVASARTGRPTAPKGGSAPGSPGAAAVPADEVGASDEPGRATPKLELYLLRHADAGDPMTWPGDDAERPLSGKGRRQARRMGRWLAELGRRPDVILTSPKARALQTATIVAACLDIKPTIDSRLAGPLHHGILADLLAEHPLAGRRLMLVGHDPDFSTLASSLSGAPVTLRKGALARIDLDGTIGAASGSLRWLIPADAVPER